MMDTEHLMQDALVLLRNQGFVKMPLIKICSVSPDHMIDCKHPRGFRLITLIYSEFYPLRVRCLDFDRCLH